MADTSIEWADKVWNPVSGCTRASAGCDHCYAVTMTNRLAAMGQAKYAGLTVLNGKGERHFNGVVRTDEASLTIPLKWKKARRVFVNSMSDLFHRDVPFEFVDKVFAVMALTPHHTYQILTKRPERMAEYLSQTVRVDPPESSRPVDVCAAHRRIRKASEDVAEKRSGGGCWREHYNNLWPMPNVWLGTSVENQEAADARIPHLLKCPAAVRFLSCEPLLGGLNLQQWLEGHETPGTPFSGARTVGGCAQYTPPIDWVIVGGESGHGARPCNVRWIRGIVAQCRSAGVDCFVKQVGAMPEEMQTYGGWPAQTKREGDRLKLIDKKGGDWNEWPEGLRVREFPGVLVASPTGDTAESV